MHAHFVFSSNNYCLGSLSVFLIQAKVVKPLIFPFKVFYLKIQKYKTKERNYYKVYVWTLLALLIFFLLF